VGVGGASQVHRRELRFRPVGPRQPVGEGRPRPGRGRQRRASNQDRRAGGGSRQRGPRPHQDDDPGAQGRRGVPVRGDVPAAHRAAHDIDQAHLVRARRRGAGGGVQGVGNLDRRLLDHFQPEPDEYLIFFGRIHHDKGTKEAIEIATACNKKLILAGIIQDEAYYNKYIVPYLDGKNVVFVGSAGPVQRNQLLGKASALLHPINFNEPFGLTVIESMACGTPVIAFNRGSMPELIENGKSGFLVNTVSEAIAAVARVKDINRAYCRHRVEQYFTINRMVEEYIQVYGMILEMRKEKKYRK